MSQDISLDLPDHNWHNWDEIMTHGDALRIFYRKHLCFMGKKTLFTVDVPLNQSIDTRFWRQKHKATSQSASLPHPAAAVLRHRT